MKKLITTFLVLFLSCGLLFAEDEDVELDTFDQCNNWARHYCRTGNHEEAVNQELLKMKKAGVPITVSRIKRMAQAIRPDTVPEPED